MCNLKLIDANFGTQMEEWMKTTTRKKNNVEQCAPRGIVDFLKIISGHLIFMF